MTSIAWSRDLRFIVFKCPGSGEGLRPVWFDDDPLVNFWTDAVLNSPHHYDFRFESAGFPHGRGTLIAGDSPAVLRQLRNSVLLSYLMEGFVFHTVLPDDGSALDSNRSRDGFLRRLERGELILQPFQLLIKGDFQPIAIADWNVVDGKEVVLIFRHVDRLFACIANGRRDDDPVAGQNNIPIDFHSDTHALRIDFMEMCPVFFNAPFFVKALYFIQIEDIICSAISLLGKDTDTGLWKLSTGRQFPVSYLKTAGSYFRRLKRR